MSKRELSQSERKVLDGIKRLNESCISVDMSVKGIRREFASNIRNDNRLDAFSNVIGNRLSEQYDAMKRILKDETAMAERIRDAYQMPEGSPARVWAEMMLLSYEGTEAMG